MKFKLEYYWFLIFALCFTAFDQIQDNIRPSYSGDHSILFQVKSCTCLKKINESTC